MVSRGGRELVQLGADGRMMHTAATRELETLTKEANRNDPAVLEQWVSARTVLVSPRARSFRPRRYAARVAGDVGEDCHPEHNPIRSTN
jgi:hypothetical protein